MLKLNTTYNFWTNFIVLTPNRRTDGMSTMMATAASSHIVLYDLATYMVMNLT